MVNFSGIRGAGENTIYSHCLGKGFGRMRSFERNKLTIIRFPERNNISIPIPNPMSSSLHSKPKKGKLLSPVIVRVSLILMLTQNDDRLFN